MAQEQITAEEETEHQERVSRWQERLLRGQERTLWLQEMVLRGSERIQERTLRVQASMMQLRTHNLLPTEEAEVAKPILFFPKNIEIADECPICLGTAFRLVLGCRHTVCTPCIQKIKICPICRHEIQLDLVKSV